MGKNLKSQDEKLEKGARKIRTRKKENSRRKAEELEKAGGRIEKGRKNYKKGNWRK